MTAAHAMPETMDRIVEAVHAGLHDIEWIDRCPLLATYRAESRWPELRATVAARADTLREVPRREQLV